MSKSIDKALSWLGIRKVDTNNKYKLASRNFAGEDLSHCDLRGEYFHKCNLEGTNLEEVDLTKADLSYVNLSYAYLNAARLSDAVLVNANLYAAKSNGVRVVMDNQ